AWKEMIESIRTHGAADLTHTLNYLTLPDWPLRLVAVNEEEGQLDIDRFYRYQESLQAFFDEAAAVETRFAACASGPPTPTGPLRGGPDVEHGALGVRRDSERRPGGHRRVGRQAIDVLIRVPGIVVKRHEVPDVREPRKRQRMLERAVAPADVRRVLGETVLRVVHEQIDPARQQVPGGPVRAQREVRHAERGLVIGEIGQRAPVAFDAVPDREPGMTDAVRQDEELAHAEGAAGHLMQDQVGKLAQMDGEEWRRQIASQPVAQFPRRLCGSPEMRLDLGIE